jgi:hypothetical protein
MGVNLFGTLVEIFPPEISNDYVPIFCFITLVLPVLLSLLLSQLFVKWYQRRKQIKLIWFPRNKVTISIVAGLYVLTAFAGIPSVQSHNSKWAVEEYKRINTGDQSHNSKWAVEEYKRINTGDNQRVWESHPYISSYFSVPVLPLVVMSYHEYQLAGVYGWGGWDIQLWYLFGVKRLLRLPFWVS